MKGLKPKTARQAEVKQFISKVQKHLDIEARLFALVEAGKLNEEEMKILKAYKELYQLRSINKDIFGPKTMKEYKIFRETLLEKYDHKS